MMNNPVLNTHFYEGFAALLVITTLAFVIHKAVDSSFLTFSRNHHRTRGKGHRSRANPRSSSWTAEWMYRHYHHHDPLVGTTTIPSTSHRSKQPLKKDEEMLMYYGCCDCQAIQFQFQAPDYLVAFQPSRAESRGLDNNGQDDLRTMNMTTFPQLCVPRLYFEFQVDRTGEEQEEGLGLGQEQSSMINADEIPFLVESSTSLRSEWYMCQSCGVNILAHLAHSDVMVLNFNCVQNLTDDYQIISIPLEIIELYNSSQHEDLDRQQSSLVQSRRQSIDLEEQDPEQDQEQQQHLEEKDVDATFMAWTLLRTDTSTYDESSTQVEPLVKSPPLSSLYGHSDTSSNSSTISCSSSQLSTNSLARGGVNQVLLMKEQMERYLKHHIPQDFDDPKQKKTCSS